MTDSVVVIAAAVPGVAASAPLSAPTVGFHVYADAVSCEQATAALTAPPGTHLSSACRSSPRQGRWPAPSETHGVPGTGAPSRTSPRPARPRPRPLAAARNRHAGPTASTQTGRPTRPSAGPVRRWLQVVCR